MWLAPKNSISAAFIKEIINGIVGKHIKKSNEDTKRAHHFKRKKMIMPSFKLGFVNWNFINQMSGSATKSNFFEAKYADMFIHTHYVSKNISRETVPISKWLLLPLLWEASSFTRSMHLLNFSELLWEKFVFPTLEPYSRYQQHWQHELSCNIDSLVGA